MFLFVVSSFYFCRLTPVQPKETVRFWNHGLFLRVFILRNVYTFSTNWVRAGIVSVFLFIITIHCCLILCIPSIILCLQFSCKLQVLFMLRKYFCAFPIFLCGFLYEIWWPKKEAIEGIMSFERTSRGDVVVMERKPPTSQLPTCRGDVVVTESKPPTSQLPTYSWHCLVTYCSWFIVQPLIENIN